MVHHTDPYDAHYAEVVLDRARSGHRLPLHPSFIFSFIFLLFFLTDSIWKESAPVVRLHVVQTKRCNFFFLLLLGEMFCSKQQVQKLRWLAQDSVSSDEIETIREQKKKKRDFFFLFFRFFLLFNGFDGLFAKQCETEETSN